MITTPAQRRATARAIKKRELAGIKRSTFSLPADARERLEALKAETGMPKDHIVAAAILAYRGGHIGCDPVPAKPEPAKPAAAKVPKPANAKAVAGKPAAAAKFRGLTASGEELPVRGPVPKGTRR